MLVCITRQRTFGIYSEVGSGFQSSLLATKMAGTKSGWTDRVTSGLLEALRTREACGIPNPRVMKTEMQRSSMHLEEIVEILKEDIQDIDLAAVKVNIQLTFFFSLESPSFVEMQARLGPSPCCHVCLR